MTETIPEYKVDKVKKLKLKPYGFAQPTMAGINLVYHDSGYGEEGHFTVDLVLWVQTEERTDFPIILPTHISGDLTTVLKSAYIMAIDLAGSVINMAPVMDEDCNVIREISISQYLKLDVLKGE